MPCTVYPSIEVAPAKSLEVPGATAPNTDTGSFVAFGVSGVPPASAFNWPEWIMSSVAYMLGVSPSATVIGDEKITVVDRVAEVPIVTVYGTKVAPPEGAVVEKPVV